MFKLGTDPPQLTRDSWYTMSTLFRQPVLPMPDVHSKASDDFFVSSSKITEVLEMKTFKDQGLKGAYSLQPHAEAPSSAQIGSSLAANVNVVKMVQDEQHLVSTDKITSKEYCARLMCRAVQKSQACFNVG